MELDRISIMLARAEVLCKDSFAPSVTPTTEWSDAYFLNLNRDLKYNEIYNQRNKIADIYTRFTYFYFYGIIPKDTTAESIIASIISQISYKIPTSQELGMYFSANEFASSGLCIDTLTVEPPAAGAQFNLCTAEASVRAILDGRIANAAYKRHTLYNVRDAYDWMLEEIASLSPEGAQTRRECAFRRYCGFLALVLLRSLIKTEGQLGGSFYKKTLIRNLRTLTGVSTNVQYAPPCTLAVASCVAALQKGILTARQIFIKVLSVYTNAMKNDDVFKLTPLLMAGLLTPLQGNGMGLISLCVNASIHVKVSWQTICRYSNIEGLKYSWDRIRDFSLKYFLKAKGSEEYSFLWARVVSDIHFKKLATKDNVRACIVFAAMVSKSDEDSIWSAKWATDIQAGFTNFRNFGRTLTDDLTRNKCTEQIAEGLEQADQLTKDTSTFSGLESPNEYEGSNPTDEDIEMILEGPSTSHPPHRNS